MDAAPFPKGGGTALLRYDCWNLCVRSFGEPSPDSPIRGGGGWEIGLKAPPHPAMDPGPWANPPKKKPSLPVYIGMYTQIFLIQTRNQSYKRWENATWGHKAQATNVQNTILQCFEFL